MGALGELFAEIADAIRSKTAGTDLLKPAEFADEIMSIVVGSGGNSGGGSTTETVGNLKMASSGFTSNGGRNQIAHGLGVVPDLVIVTMAGIADIGTEVEEYVSTLPMLCAYGAKSTLDETMNRYITSMWALHTDYGIDNTPNAAKNGYIYCDNESIYVGREASADNGKMPAGQSYSWFAIAGMGSGSDPNARYVTFMSYDGSVEYGKKAVAVGDDCADPIARGVFATPTRESSAQYDYSFVGWATTPNGAWDENALKAVTADRTLYAAYASAVRYYTVSFYDGDTLLTTKQVAYGGSTTYEPPAKDGYFFDKWEPAPENVTSDLNCYAQYSMDIDFATASWADIAALSEAGEAAKYFAIGDEKEITFTGLNGTSFTMPVQIIAFNHDELSDGTKVGITVRTKYNAGWVSNANSEQVTYNSITGYYAGGWPSCELRTKLNADVLLSMPEDLQSVIKSVKKVSNYYVDGTTTTGQRTSQDKLWLFSAGEISTKGATSYGIAIGDGALYSGIDPKVYNANGDSGEPYGLRTGSFKSKANMGIYHNTNGLSSSSAGSTKYIVFGFCI